MKNSTIHISNKERLLQSQRCWIYQIQINDVWINKTYHANLKDTYCNLLEMFIINSNKETVKEALKETIEKLENIKKEIIQHTL